MSPAGYSENALVEQPAIALFSELGWQTCDAYTEFEHGASVLGRETKADVVLLERLRPALSKLNPDLPSEALDHAIEELVRDRSRMSLAAANRDIYDLLKNGVRVRHSDPQGDGETVEYVRIIDWENPGNNDFLLCSQFWITGEMHTRRADLVGFVNGLPLVFVELKATHRRLETAYTGNLTDYKDSIPHIFWYNALVILSNGSQSLIASVTAGWEHFCEWKKISSEEEPARVSLETMLRGVCKPARLLDIVENFTLFQEATGGIIKLIAKNHQYLGVNNAIDALNDIKQRQGRLGVFWHTQGSGKSVSMIFFSQKVLRKVPGNWTFVIVTDRIELDQQIYKNFASAHVVTEGHAQAQSCHHLQQLLSEDHRYIFTLIHKFREPEKISHRDDIIVITDEAHRSQYDTLALNMRTALPNASFLAFTGTPLIVGEEKTREVFGDYISIYDFQQSVQDRATVPLYYENRIPELQLTNENLNRDMERLLEQAELDDAQEKKLEREFAREYHLITRDDRLETVAQDIVDHFTGRGFKGKAMVICIDKATAVRMYNKVQKYWSQHRDNLQKKIGQYAADNDSEITEHIQFMQTTDMAVVVSQGQNEIKEMQDKGLDIRPHRKRMVEEDLDTKFKDPDDPFRLVFVCAMWMTGFDVPNCATLYLDKPMRNHTLMQTIARANRVYPGKVSGLIVDYVGVFRNLEKALAIYGTGHNGTKPVEDKGVLLSALRKALEKIERLCHEHNVDLHAIKKADGFERVGLLDDAVEALIVSEDVKLRFLELANNVKRLYKAILPDKNARGLSRDVEPVKKIAEKIHNLSPPADISGVMQNVEKLLDASVSSEGYVIREPVSSYGENHLFDLSDIDFEKLKKRFERGRKRTLTEQLKGSVERKLHTMVRLNQTRMDFMERFQQMIDDYNAGSLNVEEFFKKLMEFASTLEKEEKRSVSEQLSEEELAIFDLLTKPEMELTAKERKEVKKTARQLLEKLKQEKLVLDWRKRQQSRADVRVTIEKILDDGLPRAFTPELFEKKTTAVFQHVYDAYYGAGRSVYSAVA